MSQHEGLSEQQVFLSEQHGNLAEQQRGLSAQQGNAFSLQQETDELATDAEPEQTPFKQTIRE